MPKIWMGAIHQKGNLKHFTKMKCVHFRPYSSGTDKRGLQCNTERFMVMKGFISDLLNLKIKKKTFPFLT